MNLILGIDYRGGYRASIATISALGLQGETYTLVHGWGSKQVGPFANSKAVPMTNILGSVLEKEAENLMRSAQSEAHGVISNVSTRIMSEQAIPALATAAEEAKADFVVVSPTVRSNSIRPFGATVHAMIELMPTHLVVAREPDSTSVIEEAMFISDGTPASAVAFKQFLKFKPGAIQKLTVLNLCKAAVAAGPQSKELPEGIDQPTLNECITGVNFANDVTVFDEFIAGHNSKLLVTHSQFHVEELNALHVLAAPLTVMLFKTY
jgi:hypothetical protein